MLVAVDVFRLHRLLMKVVVTLYVAGKTFDEEVVVARYEDAAPTALARNPSKSVRVINQRIVIDA